MVELTNKYDKLRVFYYQNRMVVLPGKNRTSHLWHVQTKQSYLGMEWGLLMGYETIKDTHCRTGYHVTGFKMASY